MYGGGSEGQDRPQQHIHPSEQQQIYQQVINQNILRSN